jgi:hypothetical protein
MKETGELAGAGLRAREVTVQAGDRGGAAAALGDIPGTSAACVNRTEWRRG